jgi:hypothetical protein
MLKALMANHKLQGTQPLTPLGRSFFSRSEADPRLNPPQIAISAALSAEDDFELGGEFLDVFVRAGERVAGFLVGCMLIAGVWLLCVVF